MSVMSSDDLPFGYQRIKHEEPNVEDENLKKLKQDFAQYELPQVNRSVYYDQEEL